jgi:hypothetical protein
LDLEFLQKVKTLFKDLLENISIKSCDLAWSRTGKEV